MARTIRLATRGSALALTQSNAVAARVRALGLGVDIEVRKTQGDAVVDRPFKAMEGKGFFTKELEEALLADEADLAVHSLKDLPTELPAGLTLAATPEREDPADLILIRECAYDAFRALPVKSGARVGTSSARRRAQWIARRPDTALADLRGNVPTRVEKLRRGEYDAVLLASAGLRRLNADLSGLRVVRLDPTSFIGAPGQGALGLETRAADAPLLAALRALDDPEVRAAVDAERAVLAALGGGCSQPVGAFAYRSPGAPDARAFRLDAAVGPEAEGAAPMRRVHVEAESFEAAAGAAVAALRSDASLVAFTLRGKSIILTQQAGRAEAAARALEERGAQVWIAPLVTTHAVDDVRAAEAITRAPEFDAIAITSATAAAAFVERIGEAGVAVLRSQGAPRVFAAGAASAEPLLDAGIAADAGDGSGAAAVAKTIIEYLHHRPAGSRRGRGVLFPCALEPRADLPRELAAAGVACTPAPLYRTEGAAPGAFDALRGRSFDFAVFFSPSAVRRWAELAPFACTRAAAAGRATAAAWAETGGAPAVIAPSPSADDVARALEVI